VPPSQVGGLASMLQSQPTDASQLAEQSAEALTEAEQLGGSKSITSSPWALRVPLAPNLASICAVAREHSALTRSVPPWDLAAVMSSLSAPMSVAMFR